LVNSWAWLPVDNFSTNLASLVAKVKRRAATSARSGATVGLALESMVAG
jgi:hypothetical protein